MIDFRLLRVGNEQNDTAQNLIEQALYEIIA